MTSPAIVQEGVANSCITCMYWYCTVRTVYMDKGFEIMQINYFVFCGANIIKEFQVIVSSGVRSEGVGHGGFWPPGGGGPGRGSGFGGGLQGEGEGGRGEGADQRSQYNKMAEVLLNQERDRQILTKTIIIMCKNTAFSAGKELAIC